MEEVQVSTWNMAQQNEAWHWRCSLRTPADGGGGNTAAACDGGAGNSSDSSSSSCSLSDSSLPST